MSASQAAPEPALASLQQMSPGQSISDQLRRLTVSLPANVFDLKADKLLDGTSNLSKGSCHRTRYDPVPPTTCCLISQKEPAATKEQVDGLMKLLDKSGLGTNEGDVASNLQSARSDALLVSAIPVPRYSTPIEFSLVPWNGSETSSKAYLIASRMRVAWKGMMPRLCLKSWMRFEPLSLTAK